MTGLADDDLALVDRASKAVGAHGDDELHRVAAATRALDGRVVVSLNVYHYEGGSQPPSSG